MFLVIIARLVNIVICSKISNISRTTNIIDSKKQFFLWFAGVRGAMAFALAIKSITDFKLVGSMFLMITLIITAFTLIYSSVFLNLVIQKCDILEICQADNFTESSIASRANMDIFSRFKAFCKDTNENLLLKMVNRLDDSLLSINSSDKDNNSSRNNDKISVISGGIINNNEGNSHNVDNNQKSEANILSNDRNIDGNDDSISNIDKHLDRKLNDIFVVVKENDFSVSTNKKKTKNFVFQ